MNDDFRNWLAGTISDIANRSLPRDAYLEYDFDGETFYLETFVMPTTRSGTGTKFLAEVLALMDHIGWSSKLIADSNGEPEDPSTLELVNWYRRLGFKLDGLDYDFLIEMSRENNKGLSTKDILRLYEERRASDLSPDEFDAWMADALAKAEIAEAEYQAEQVRRLS